MFGDELMDGPGILPKDQNKSFADFTSEALLYCRKLVNDKYPKTPDTEPVSDGRTDGVKYISFLYGLLMNLGPRFEEIQEKFEYDIQRDRF